MGGLPLFLQKKQKTLTQNAIKQKKMDELKANEENKAKLKGKHVDFISI